MSIPTFAPFSKERQICSDLDLDNRTESTTLPGWPDVLLSDVEATRSHLQREFWAVNLETEARHLWILSTCSGANIHALHEQKVRGREIVITEDPRLHLVWSENRIFIKPLPMYLLAHDFWLTDTAKNDKLRVPSREEIRRACLGFLRSYRYLIQHESDLAIAQREEHQLIPHGVSWDKLHRLLVELQAVHDLDVSMRYHYGEIRLSRLNLYAPLLFHRLSYIHMPRQYATYFSRLYGPILVIFVIASTMLNAMQVNLAADVLSIRRPAIVDQICYWFSTVTMLIVASVVVVSTFLWIYMVVNEWRFAINHQLQQRRRGRKTHP